MALKGEIGGILKHSTIYGIGNILHRIPPLLLLPVYLNYLTTNDFGKKEIISLVIEFLGIVISMGVASAMSRFYYEYEDRRRQNEVVSTIVISYAVVAGVILAALGTQAEFLVRAIGLDAGDHVLVVLALASLWMNTIYLMLGNYLRIREKSVLFVSISLTKLVLALTLNIVFIVHLGYGILGIFLSTFISALTVTVLLSVPLLCRIGFSVSLPKLKEIVSFGAPLIVAQLAGAIVHLSDRYFIKSYLDLTSVAVYTAGYRIGNSINALVNSPFQQIWNPRRFALHKSEDAGEIYAAVFTYYLFLMVLCGTLLAACAGDLILVLGRPEYYGAPAVVPLITLAYILFGAQHHFTTGIMIRKKTKYLANILLATAALNLLLNFLIIPRYGIMGAAVSTLASMTLRLVLTAWISQRTYPVRWEWRRMLRVFGAGAIAWYACSLLRYPGAFDAWVADFGTYHGPLRLMGLRYLAYHALIGLAVYLAIVFLPGFLREGERAFAREKLGGLARRFRRA